MDTRAKISHPYPPSYSLEPAERAGKGYNGHEQSRLEMERMTPASSRDTRDLERGKEDEYPEGWTKEDEAAEKEFMERGMIDWDEMKKWRFWIRLEWWYYYLIAAVICVLVILMTIYHDNLTSSLPAGWLIPIAVLFVISFPPLFGHEIVAVLVGVVWGLWVGFGIVSAGTLLGEIGNFYAFKYWLRSHAEKYERNNFNYACMAHVVREGGFFIIFVVRLSAIPGHFTTAVFATCGMNIWIFTLAAVLTLPKQLIVVYLGVMFAEPKDTSAKEKWVSRGVLIGGFLMTIWAAWYIWHRMNKVRRTVWRRRRIEAAAQGLVLDPKTGVARPSTNAGLMEWETAVPPLGLTGDDEARSPILAGGQRREGSEMEEIGISELNSQGKTQKYQNPYDIRYDQVNRMSTYDDDSITPLRPSASTPHPPSGHLHSQHLPHYHPPQENVSFPQAQSTGVESIGAGPSVHRSGTGFTIYPREEEKRVEFPEARPVVL
ncbi:uncharacterized protein L203_106062 [Cryptococcus depauperatus CBS 7841]|uniref:Golgi apparatus membrane protein TVP38 n=1 Tax=Cryptococcus depauperatus CBS 7841 TaxID=1295531 RepID=A0AAJ8JYU3_9TREE